MKQQRIFQYTAGYHRSEPKGKDPRTDQTPISIIYSHLKLNLIAKPHGQNETRRRLSEDTCSTLLELEFTCRKTEFKKPNEAGAVCYESYTKNEYILDRQEDMLSDCF